MKVEKIQKLPIIHFIAETQKELTTSFVRISEFYESNYPEIHGKYFDLNTYKKLYAKDHGKFSYYTDWSGFNIPSSNFKKFYEIFSEKLTKKEKFIFDEVEKIMGNVFTRKHYYVIGTYKNTDQKSTFDHEVAHSLYALKRSYRKKCEEIYKTIPKQISEKIKTELMEMGYCEEVVEDETQAYLCTDTIYDLKNRFSLAYSEIPIEAIYEYQTNFTKFNRD